MRKDTARQSTSQELWVGDSVQQDMWLTLPETTSKFAPENKPSQKETNLPTIAFQGLGKFQGE